MKRSGTKNPSVLLKTVSIFIILILSGSLLATGLMASGECNIDCCCKMRKHSNTQKQMQIPQGCCSQASQKPCDMQSSKPFDLPEAVFVSKGVYGPDFFNFETIQISDNADQIDLSDDHTYHLAERKFRSPPLFLKNRSFLI